MTLPESFLRLPITHRALHDLKLDRPENTRAAISAAIEAGYGIEIDIQPSADGVAMVFHDDVLNRLTDDTGPVSDKTADQLCATKVMATQETIPTLDDVLGMVAGQVPLLIEIKDQDGAMGPNVGPLEADVARALTGYEGPVAVMSFNPHSVAAMAELAPQIPRGIVTSPCKGLHWNGMPEEQRAHMRAIADYDRTGSCFISHQADDLASKRVAELKSGGAAILCWTIRSAKEEALARQVAQNVTFEGYMAEIPSA